MMKLSLEISDAAAQEIINQALYYREESPDSSLEQRWDNAVNQTVQSLLSMPERGSPCHFQSSDLPDMRWVSVAGFSKHIVVYVLRAKERVVHVVHILHGARDLEAFFDNDL